MPGTTTYIKAFADTLTVHIRGVDHGLHRATMTVDVIAALPSRDGSSLMLTPYFFWGWWAIDPVTQDVQVHLGTNKYAGLVRLTAQAA